jgi:formate dehydrogenase subunit gamma
MRRVQLGDIQREDAAMMTCSRAGSLHSCGAASSVWLIIALLSFWIVAAAPAVPALAQAPAPDIPSEAVGSSSSAETWHDIRLGATGTVSIPDRQAAQLIQSEGDTWRAVRNGPLSIYSAYAVLGMVALLSLFFVLRGRIRIEHGRAGVTIERFTTLERFGHWLMATSFVLLALSGLNMLFGRTLMIPLIGKEAFAVTAMWGKYLHNYLAFAFMAGVALVFVLWVAQNLPNRHDIKWLLRGGGLFTRGSHPPARKFNAGQKIIFWLVVIATISVSLSGIALMFPYETTFMAKTFAALNLVGFDLATDISPLREQQLNQLWHAMVGVAFIVIIMAHIYLGTIGMEGAFDAMGSGQVDLNWAREHHGLWVEELEGKVSPHRTPASEPTSRTQPAE